MYDLLDGASLATLSNVQQDDETLPAFERTALEAMMEPIEAVLRLPGCSPDTFDDVDDEGSTVPHNAPRSSTTSASRDVLADSGLSP